jgi:RNA polymerase sigma-70 factor (ECF subfamily)
MKKAAEAGLRELYDAHASALFGFALRLTGGDRGRAEDIVQETLLRAWKNPQALTRDRGAVRPWLFTVARHLSVDAHRARSARPLEVPDSSLSAMVEADQIDACLDRLVVADALAALTPEHRSVLLATYYRGCSVAQASAALNVPPGTVKSRTYYALRALKLALTERGVTT